MLPRTNVFTPRTLRTRSAALLAALMLLGGFFVPLSANAVHTHSVVASPAIETGSTATTYTFSVTNDGTDSINRVQITKPVDFSGLSCGAAPSGWAISTATGTMCEYTDGISDAIDSGETLPFTIDVTTAVLAGTYGWTVQTQDLLFGADVSTVNVDIDTTAPTAAITYSDADGRVKAGDSLTITATFTEDMDAGQDVELSLRPQRSRSSRDDS
ncbi:MAG: hypothetical protein QY311_03300 [Candidatus Paceibacterota bacterium]|nr:MAG: hypothetical protein QY311_03300 [Candidatus Paceibacterota bacterium]